MRRTLVQMLVDELKVQPRNQASVRRLSMLLGWDEAKVQRVVIDAETNQAVPVSRGPGGVIKFWGSERGSSVGLYYGVKRVVEGYWCRDQGLREPDVTITAQGGHRKVGVWSHPDLVLRALPRRRRNRTDPPDYHSIEVETYTGFDIRSVYQAHAQGRGANFSWVFYATSKKATPNIDRIEWAADQLGIGLVQFTKPGASGTYEVTLEARRREVTPEDREAFCHNSGVSLEP